jgi:hypothetical protein
MKSNTSLLWLLPVLNNFQCVGLATYHVKNFCNLCTCYTSVFCSFDYIVLLLFFCALCTNNITIMII